MNREEVRSKIAQLIFDGWRIEDGKWVDGWRIEDGKWVDGIGVLANKILALPEIAIVDREAKPPDTINNPAYSGEYKFAQNEMIKQDWVKEIK